MGEVSESHSVEEAKFCFVLCVCLCFCCTHCCHVCVHVLLADDYFRGQLLFQNGCN